MTNVLKLAWFHKKGLGFRSLPAASLVAREDVLQCKKRFLVLIQPNVNGTPSDAEADAAKDEPWHIRVFKTEPETGAAYVTAPLATVVSDPSIPLRAVVVLDGDTEVKLINGILSICTKERTLLLASETVDEVNEWFNTIEAYLATRRQIENVASEESSKPAARRLSTALNNQQQATTRAGSDVSGVMSLESVLMDANLRKQFRVFVQSAFAAENLDFYEAVESYLRIPEHDLDAQRESVERIVDRFVKENAPDQVNLASNQVEALVESLKHPEMPGQTLLCLLQCQHEIQELLKRNFFRRFVSMLDQERKRTRLLAETQGCFPAVIGKTGLDGFLTMLELFKAMISDNRLLLTYVRERYNIIKGFVTHVREPSTRLGNSLSKKLPSSGNAINSTFETFELQSKVLWDYLDEVSHAVEEPLDIMIKHVDVTLQQITQDALGRCQQIIQLREKAITYGHNELVQKGAVVDLSTKLAELESAGKKKEKELKKALLQFEKLKRESEATEKGRSDAEVELALAESALNDDLHPVMLQLESLALYCLDTVKDHLRRLAYAEQTVLTRLGLKFQNTIDECSSVDTIRDLLALSQEAEKIGLEKRKTILQPALLAAERTIAERTPVQAAIVVDSVPMAEPVSTPRRRFF